MTIIVYILQEWNAVKKGVAAEVKKLKAQLKDLKAKERESQDQDQGKGRGQGRRPTKGKGRMPSKSVQLEVLEARLEEAEGRTIKGTLIDDNIKYLQVGYDDKFIVRFCSF